MVPEISLVSRPKADCYLQSSPVPCPSTETKLATLAQHYLHLAKRGHATNASTIITLWNCRERLRSRASKSRKAPTELVFETLPAESWILGIPSDISRNNRLVTTSKTYCLDCKICIHLLPIGIKNLLPRVVYLSSNSQPLHRLLLPADPDRRRMPRFIMFN
jgi:hypothetical protein